MLAPWLSVVLVAVVLLSPALSFRLPGTRSTCCLSRPATSSRTASSSSHLLLFRRRQICFSPECKPKGLSAREVLYSKASIDSDSDGDRSSSSRSSSYLPTTAGWRMHWQQRRLEIALDFKRNPWTYLTIPIVAALVGYITNYVGVKMLFYPITWRGLPILRWENQPLGLLGWQGIVPAKRVAMATKMVDVTISRLLSVKEVFGRLEPRRLAELLTPTVSGSVLGGWLPRGILRFFLRRTASDMLSNIEKVVDVKALVVSGMTTDPSVLGSFFQRVAAKELKFLIDSGFGFGFLLGILQMVQWMLYPRNWTLPVGGAVVGLITNWIALKWIFEPLNPTKVGPFVLQGMFLKRQVEVSRDFSEYIADRVLTSQKVWQGIFAEATPALREFSAIVSRNVPLPTNSVNNIINTCRSQLGFVAEHPLHAYMNERLNLKAILIERMNRLTPAEFEQVLHPIFQQDELTLIIAGGVLGAIAGLLQMWVNDVVSARAAKAATKKDQPAPV